MPSTKNLLRSALALWAIAMLAPASTAVAADTKETEIIPSERTIPHDESRIQFSNIPDPWEGWNRRVYAFNTQFDRYIFLPSVRGYQKVTPDPLEKGISNAFQNVGEVRTFLHSFLQLKPRSMGITLGRLVVNSTLGIGGLLDPASDMGLVLHREDFGQTLGHWGVGNGPYLVLPIFGPSNARDTGGMLGDYALTMLAYEAIGLNDSDQFALRSSITVLRALDMRANLAFRYYETGSPFEYELVRYLYTQLRRVEIAK